MHVGSAHSNDAIIFITDPVACCCCWEAVFSSLRVVLADFYCEMQKNSFVFVLFGANVST